MKTVLIDSSSAILLFKSGLLPRLIEAYRVSMAGSVFEELTVKGYPGASDFLDLKSGSCLRVHPPLQKGVSPLTEEIGCDGLGRGERDTIALFQTGVAGFVLMDDRKGADACRRLHIPYTNALLFPRLMWFAGRMTDSDCRTFTEAVLHAGWYGADIVSFARTCPKERVEGFLP